MKCLIVRANGNGHGREIRCPCCNRKVAVVLVPGGRYELFCVRCKTLFLVETWPDDYQPPPAPAVPVQRVR